MSEPTDAGRLVAALESKAQEYGHALATNSDLLASATVGYANGTIAARTELLAHCASRDQEIARLKGLILHWSAKATKLTASNEALERRLEEANEDDLLLFLDDTFSGGNEIRFVPTRDPIYRHRTEERHGVTTVWVENPRPINDEGDTARPHETLSDALRAWYKRDAVKPAPRADQGAEPKAAESEPDWVAWKSHLRVCAECTAGETCPFGRAILGSAEHDDAPWLRVSPVPDAEPGFEMSFEEAAKLGRAATNLADAEPGRAEPAWYLIRFRDNKAPYDFFPASVKAEVDKLVNAGSAFEAIPLFDRPSSSCAPSESSKAIERAMIAAQCGYCRQGIAVTRHDNHRNFGPPVVWAHNEDRFLGDCQAMNIHEYLYQRARAPLATSTRGGDVKGSFECDPVSPFLFLDVARRFR